MTRPLRVSVILDEELAGLDLLADGGEDLGDPARPFGVEGRLHLHGLDREQLLPLADRVADDDGHADDQAGQGGADLVRVVRVGLGGLAHGGGERAVDDLDLAGLAVQLEEDGALAVGVGLADGQELDDQRLARLDLDEVLGRRVGPEEEDRGRQDRRVGVRPLVRGEVGEDAGVEQVGSGRRGRWRAGRAARRPSRGRRRGRPGGRPAPGRSVIAGRPFRTRSWRTAREAAGGLAEPPLEELDDALGEGELALGVERVGRASGCSRPGTGPCRRRPSRSA